MRLHATDDFRDALVAAAQEAQLDDRFVEKDYYVTEVLRVIADTQASRAIFKGGTSLSKGWQLIDRFSEDIDLFIDPEIKPALSKRGIDRELRKLRDAVAGHPALTYIEDEGRTIGGLGREDHFSYSSLFDELPGLRSVILVEPGIQSGRQPTEDVQISSIVGDFLRRRGDGDLADDLEPFQMTLLHFRRTFVEKLFTVHGKVERLKVEAHPLGRDARHYADLHVLAAQPEVDQMLRSEEYGEIKRDYDERSQRFFPRAYRPPEGLSFRDSEALLLPEPLRAQIKPDYEAECERLFSGAYPSLDDVVEKLESVRELL